MTEDRRKSPRVPVYVKVIDETSEAGFGFSYARDISAGGMALDCKVLLNEELKLQKGSTVKLKFKIPGGKFYITALGKIKRIEKLNNENMIVAFEFTSIDEDFKKEIESFVEQVRKGTISFT